LAGFSLNSKSKICLTPPEKLFAMYAHIYREAQRTLPELKFKDADLV
jgi:hypothetical protein